MGRQDKEKKTKAPASGRQKLGVLALIGALGAGLVAIGNSVDAVGKICKDDMLKALCDRFGRHESPDKLIAALDSKSPVEIATALKKLKEVVEGRAASVGEIALPFAVYFNARYRHSAAGAAKTPDDPIIAGLSLQLLSALAQARQKQSGAARLEISNVDLQRANLAGMHLPGVAFNNVMLHDANLEGADLQDAVISESRFDRVRANKLLAAGAQWQRTCLEGAQLQGANFKRAQLTDVDLNATDLSGADFGGSGIERVRFSGALLGDTLFAGAKVQAVSGFISPESAERLKAASVSPASVFLSPDTKAFGQCF
jgi:uncharacterized protein YjbI with pentapeptide repeats